MSLEALAWETGAKGLVLQVIQSKDVYLINKLNRWITAGGRECCQNQKKCPRMKAIFITFVLNAEKSSFSPLDVQRCNVLSLCFGSNS